MRIDGKEVAMGYEHRDIYDGVSLWRFNDGTWMNRWEKPYRDNPDDWTLKRRFEATKKWLDELTAAGE